LARAGLRFERAHVQNVVCMPSRSTMLTGQHPRTHGVVANGVKLPADAPSVAGYLRERGGYRTALVGKAHFDPHLDLLLAFEENRLAAIESHGPWRGFEHVELATHGPMGGHHYADWLWEHAPEAVAGFGGVLTGRGGGDTGAPEVTHNPVARQSYHTDWVADRTLGWLRQLDGTEPWFCWMSFPDPHHPFDPPLEELRARIDWRDLELPPGHPGDRASIERVLAEKPQHWLDWYHGRFRNPEGGPVSFVPSALTDDQIREIHAAIHVENELVDEACGRVMQWLRERGWDADTDVVYTSDHGELQGDFGLMFKGPYHTDALLRVPLVWRPAPSANVESAVIAEPVGHVDLAPTFCQIAGLEVPSWMEGRALPERPGSDRERVITTFDSQFEPVGMHLRTIYRDGFICTVYEPSSRGQGGVFPFYWSIWGRGSTIPRYQGTEGELYDTREDPYQHHNLWHDPVRRAWRDELVADLREHLPPARTPPLPVTAPT
jgi:arylsulfatase A-like enzyme